MRDRETSEMSVSGESIVRVKMFEIGVGGVIKIIVDGVKNAESIKESGAFRISIGYRDGGGEVSRSEGILRFKAMPCREMEMEVLP